MIKLKSNLLNLRPKKPKAPMRNQICRCFSHYDSYFYMTNGVPICTICDRPKNLEYNGI